MKVEIGTIIATRVYELPSGTKLTLSIGQPRPTAGRDGWFCPWQLIGDDGGAYGGHAAYGVDAVQALQLAMPDIGSTLARIPGVKWGNDTNLGFPTPDEWLVLSEYRSGRDKRGKQ